LAGSHSGNNFLANRNFQLPRFHGNVLVRVLQGSTSFWVEWRSVALLKVGDFLPTLRPVPIEAIKVRRQHLRRRQVDLDNQDVLSQSLGL
jgi:hypothetical protein